LSETKKCATSRIFKRPTNRRRFPGRSGPLLAFDERNLDYGIRDLINVGAPSNSPWKHRGRSPTAASAGSPVARSARTAVICAVDIITRSYWPEPTPARSPVAPAKRGVPVFGSHRVCEIRRRATGRFRRTQGDLPALFHVWIGYCKRPAPESSRQCGLMFEWVNRVILPMVSMTSGDGEMDRLTPMGVIK
jgi:hypothetical protein